MHPWVSTGPWCLIEDTMSHAGLHPSSWFVRHAGSVPEGGAVLDLACGSGRHTALFLGRGHPVTAVDLDVEDVRGLGEAELEVIEADLEGAPWPLGDRRFAGVVVSNYLWRPLWDRILAAVAEPGVLIYETFAAGNERFGKPRNLDHLLREGELLEVVQGELEVVAYEHGLVEEVTASGETRPAVKQRVCAMRGAG